MLAQGKKMYENMTNKVKQGLTPLQEGFGILGSNSDMETVIASDNAKTVSNVNNLNNNIAQYGTDYNALKEKTQEYLNDSTNNFDLKKNYNIFINQK